MVTEKHWRFIVVGVVVLALWIGHMTEGKSGQPPSSAVPATVVVPYYAPPAHAELCGEAAPLNIREVAERFDREFTIVVYGHAQVYLWLKRMERYFPWLEKKLASEGLPQDLKYVAVAESDLMTGSVSPAGAKGPWQFMQATGANYGLNQSEDIDERLDFELATTGALRYLRDLNGLLGNWTLAIAAYNCGENRVADELKRQKATSYYDLKLPVETERYIFRILAIKEVLSHPERYGYSLPKGAGYSPIRADQVSVKLPGAAPLQSVAETMGITYRELKVLNPSFISRTAPAGSLSLKVPAGKGKECEGKLDELKATCKPVVVYHKVRKGETLSAIARRYHVSEKSLKEWNQVKGNHVASGQSLKVYK